MEVNQFVPVAVVCVAKPIEQQIATTPLQDNCPHRPTPTYYILTVDPAGRRAVWAGNGVF